MSPTTHLCLLDLVFELPDLRRLAAARCPKHFGVPQLVEGDQAVRPLDDFARRAVVHFEPHDFGLGPVVLESEDVGHFGTAPAVDRLIVVAHDAQIAMARGQGLDDPILAAVGVLILVDQQMIESVGLGLSRLGKVGEKFFGAEQHVVEIDGAGGLQGVLVAAIGGGGKMFAVGLRQRGGFVRPDGGRFPAADQIDQVAGPKHRVGTLISRKTVRATPS